MVSFSKAMFGTSEHTIRFAAVVREQSSTFERRMNDCLLLLYSLPFLVCFHCLSLPATACHCLKQCAAFPCAFSLPVTA